MTIPTNPTNAERAVYAANIVKAYRAANPDQTRRGMMWYRVAHDLATTIAGDARTGAGVIAAFSARQRWELNVKNATETFTTGEPKGHTRVVLDKVRRILDGESPENVLPMHLKTGHFYRCIADPTDRDAVVIDRHAHDIAVGRRYSDRENRGLSNANRYNALADAYRHAARFVGESPMIVQATVWVAHVDSL
jgi:hypothetical protein